MTTRRHNPVKVSAKRPAAPLASQTPKVKYIYGFAKGKAEGRADMRQLLGGKGANLAEMTNLGVPVPPGFTITTEACLKFYELHKRWPDGLDEELAQKITWLETATRKGFGDPENPLLVSVRSGAAVSMPGMMDTILNLGLNERTVQGLIAKTDNPRFAYDAYRRLVQMFGDVVLGAEHKRFEEALVAKKAAHRVANDAELPAEALKELVAEFKAIIRDSKGVVFPDDPREQLHLAINAVLASWNNERAITYRKLHNIPDTLGTAVTVQSMVFGNMGPRSMTGVCFTRDPGTGEKRFYGEYLVNAQGEDVVAGIRTPLPIERLKEEAPDIYKQLASLGQQLERYFRDVQDLEFTVEEGTLFMLQCRSGKRTALAAVTVAVDFVSEGLISRDEAILRIEPSQIDQLLHPTIDPKAKVQVIAKGLPASPGAAVGRVVFEAHRAVELAEEEGERVILVRQETSPEDIAGMAAAQGILTARGGMTCVSGQTLLLTPEGLVKAAGLFEAIEQGAQPFLLAFDHRSMKTCWRRVIAAGQRRASTIQVDISQTGRARHNTLVLTPDHKMFTIRGRQLVKKPLAECLANDDFLCVIDRVPPSPELANLPNIDPYLVGALLTDGYIRLWGRKGSVTFTQKAVAGKARMIAVVQEGFKQSFGFPLSYHRQRTNTSVLRGRPITGTADDFISFRREPAERLAHVREALVPWVLGLPTEHELLLRLGLYPQVTRNRTIFNVQLVERLGDILSQTYRVKGDWGRPKYGTKFFSIRSLFQDVVDVVDRQGRVRSAAARNVLYSDHAIQQDVLPRCPGQLRAEVERWLASDLRMVRATGAAGQANTDVYNFEVLAEDELDKNFVVFSRQYSPVLVSNSHAAVVGRGMGKSCVVGCSDIMVREDERRFEVGNSVVKEGDFISLNGTTGEVMLGQVPLVEPQLTGSFKRLLEWADQTRRLGVRTNGDTPQDARIAREFGAEGIGLCRTEHMFFGEERLPAVREMILAKDVAARKKALAKLLPFQKQDFSDIFRVMEGLPVTIRLLDPPLHEFLPHTSEEIARVAEQLQVSVQELEDAVQQLREFNPMLGHRGCRLGITYPEVNEMQAQAIFEAACELAKAGVRVLPEVMIPLVGHPQEFRVTKRIIDQVAQDTMRRYQVTVSYTVGTMIEVPRAALVADAIAQEAEFFSFGTNDLTQMTFGFSRDDIGKFLPTYLKTGILEVDPFVKLDQEGVGALIRIAVQKGRSARKHLKVGICGEHGGEPSSIEFCHRAGLDYVSCSPYRVPVARLAAAQAALRDKVK